MKPGRKRKMRVLLDLFLFSSIFGTLIKHSTCKREGKTLIFPPTAPTRTQLIYGIGIPLPLEYESMTTGYVLKAEYFLPITAKDFRPLKLTPQPVNKRDVDMNQFNETWNSQMYNDESTLRFLRSIYEHESSNSGKYRWAIYSVIAAIANRMGLEGRTCVLRAICEAAETPFHEDGGLVSEMLHVIMTPSSSVDPLSKHSDNEYFHAEVLGRSGAPCDIVFKACKLSLLSIISGIYNPVDGSVTRILANRDLALSIIK